MKEEKGSFTLILEKAKGNFITISEKSFQACLCREVKTSSNTRVLSGTGLNANKQIQTKFGFDLQLFNEQKDKISGALLQVENSVSASFYDTAWVAMVPSPTFPQAPCFPECLNWIMDNQQPDGTWSQYHHPSLIKDILSSTLACVLALRRWNMGEEHVSKGLRYIESNFSFAMDKGFLSPTGFDIIFPRMINYAIDMGLDLSVRQSDIDAMHYIRQMELKRGYEDNSEGWKAYLAYIAEGLDEFCSWQDVLRYQKNNGSLFNSPSSTAAMLTHIQDDKAYNYLHLLVRKFGGSVPTLYPLHLYSNLCVVNNLEKFGIARFFSREIKNILDGIYRCWLQNDEDITSDIAACAMAFRILRMHGYNVSSDVFAQLDVNHFCNFAQGHLTQWNTVLELYKASQIKVLPNEQSLDKMNSWTSSFLNQELCKSQIHRHSISTADVNYALKFPLYTNLERVDHKRNIRHHIEGNIKIFKTSYIIDNKDLLEMAVCDYNFCQSEYQKEFEQIERWVKENKLDQLAFARQKHAYCYFASAVTTFSPEMSDARMFWAKAGVLVTVIDDFFDGPGSREELVNLITLVKRWNGNHKEEFCSEEVRILFYALYNTTNELGAKASSLQKRNVTSHIVETWVTMMETMMIEAEWRNKSSVPTMDEYIRNAYYSFGLEPMIISAIYLVGPMLSDEVIGSPECHDLLRHMSMCGRLLNDLQTFELEIKEGKLNSVTLQVVHSGGSTSIEEAKKEVESMIDSSRVELLRLVLQTEGSVVPRACKDLYWAMCKIVHLTYMNADGYRSKQGMDAAVRSTIFEPLEVHHLSIPLLTLFSP